MGPGNRGRVRGRNLELAEVGSRRPELLGSRLMLSDVSRNTEGYPHNGAEALPRRPEPLGSRLLSSNASRYTGIPTERLAFAGHT